MIVGIGVDLVDIPRFERSIERTPRLLERLFSATERLLPPRSLAARYAAKEALIKALGGSDGVHWTEIEVTPEASGRPWFTLSGSTATAVSERGIAALHLSMSHDAGLAIAYVVAESASGVAESASGVAESASGVAESASGVAESASRVAESASGVAESASGVAGVADPSTSSVTGAGHADTGPGGRL